MKSDRATLSAVANESLETEAGGNIRALRQVENSDAAASASDLQAPMRRISEASRREIGMPAGELKTLDKKVQNDGDRTQWDIEQYAELNHQVVELTTIATDSVTRPCGTISVSPDLDSGLSPLRRPQTQRAVPRHYPAHEGRRCRGRPSAASVRG